MNNTVYALKTEVCYHVEADVASEQQFGDDKVAILQWILKEPQQSEQLSRTSQWDTVAASGNEFIIEIGPRSVADRVYIESKFFLR